MSRGGGRRKIPSDLVERKRRAQEEEEEADPELKELRLRAMEAEAKMTKKKEENDPLFVYIIENFTLEMERDLQRREMNPELPWGKSYKQQLEEAQDEEEYKDLLRDLRNLYKHEKPDKELQILAFVRRDRLQTERLAVKKAKTDPGAFVTSPAADEADYRTHVNKIIAEERKKEAEVKIEVKTEVKTEVKAEDEREGGEEVPTAGASGVKSDIKSEVKSEVKEEPQDK